MANELSTNVNTNELAQYIVIKIGEEQYGIDIKYIDNIVRLPQITRVPMVPAHFLGVINLRGEVIPVMSLRIKMSLEADTPTKDTRIIIIKMAQYEAIGMMVDSVKEVVNLTSDQIEGMGSDKREEAAYVRGIGKHDGGLISLLDLELILREVDMADNNGFTIDTMSSQYFDVLKEIGNIGAGNATTALSTMLGMKVDMKVPQVRLMEFKEVGTTMGGEEQIVAGIYLVVDGDIHGSIMFVQKKESARAMVQKLMGMPPEGDDFSEMEQSALMEIGNVITAAYLNSLSSLTNLTIYPSVPTICIDMAGAILSVPAIEFGAVADKMLLIQTDFSDDESLSGYFILVPDEESDAKILHALGF